MDNSISTQTLTSKINYFFFFLFLSCFASYDLSAQCTGANTIFTEDFEDHGNTANGGAGRYTSASDFYGGSSDYFGRIRSDEDFYLTNATSSNNIHVLTPYSGQSGDYFYAAEDTNDTNPLEGTQDGNAEKNIIFTGINITGGTNLCFSGLFARGENDGCTASTYDNTDFIEVFYEVDGGGEVKAMCFNPDIDCNIPGDTSNEPLYHDPNCDGDGGEGTILTNTFQEFTFAIPTGASLDIRVSIRMDSGNEEVAVDYFRVRSDTPVLPINLSSFQAHKQDKQVLVKWVTATETNNEYFNIEHSLDGQRFQSLGKIDGAGNSSEELHYSFMHNRPVSGVNYYRLKQIDYDGTYTYSDIQSVTFKGNNNSIRIAPNPFSDELSINLPTGFQENTNIKVYDLLGQVVYSGIIEIDQLNVSLSLSNFQTGVYIVRIGDGADALVERITKL